MRREVLDPPFVCCGVCVCAHTHTWIITYVHPLYSNRVAEREVEGSSPNVPPSPSCLLPPSLNLPVLLDHLWVLLWLHLGNHQI